MKTDDALATRHSLLRRLKDWKDQESWDDFFNTYWRLIYGVAMKAGLNEAEAEDVVQETVIAVAKNIKNFQVGAEHGSFKAWLLNMTRWRIADQLRKRPKSAEPIHRVATGTSRTGTTDRVADPASLDIDALWERDWEEHLMDAAIQRVQQQVDPAQYQLFHLQVMKQWPARKVAQKMGVKLAQAYFAKYKVSLLIKKEAKRLEAELF